MGQTNPDEGKREKVRRLKERKDRLQLVNEDKKNQFDFAEKEIIKSIQMKAFGEERRELVEREICQPSGGKELSKKKYKLTPHNPYIDQKTGYIRVGSRLEFSPLEEDAKFPILLPKKDENVKYLIHHKKKIDKSIDFLRGWEEKMVSIFRLRSCGKVGLSL